MAQPTKKISSLTEATASASADSIPIVQGGVTKRIHPGSGGGLDAALLGGQSLAQVAPVGAGMEWYAATPPSGWLLLNGQAVSRTTYANLFAVIGTTWGVGNGTTTFNVPDRRESSGYGAGTYSAVTGTTHGAITAHDALALGAFADDRGQGCKYPYYGGAAGYTLPGFTAASMTNANVSLTSYTDNAVTDGTNGTPRTGTTTRGKIIGVNYIIKY